MHQASHVMRTTVLLSRNIRSIRCSHHNKRHRSSTKLTAYHTPFRGIYGIPVTPFHEDETIDWKSMESVLHFTVEAGCHGVGWSNQCSVSEYSRYSITTSCLIMNATLAKSPGSNGP